MQWELSVRHLFVWSKTFDGLNHELLIPKLRCHGLNQHPVECFRSYLSNCSQCCKINNTLGDWRKVIASVPHGSILGPLLFNIFLNYIFFFLKDTNLGKYADDSTLYAYNENLETVICNLRQEFFILANRFSDNYRVLNPGKCHFMLFSIKENEQFDLICSDITPKYSSHENILGVTIVNNLSFDEHTINICKTAKKNSMLSVE